MSVFKTINPAYNIADGDTVFAPLQVSGSKNTVAVEMSDIDAGSPSLELEQSIDGEAWGAIPGSLQVLSAGHPSHQWNVVGLMVHGAFLRVSLKSGASAAGSIEAIKLLSNE